MGPTEGRIWDLERRVMQLDRMLTRNEAAAIGIGQGIRQAEREVFWDLIQRGDRSPRGRYQLRFATICGDPLPGLTIEVHLREEYFVDTEWNTRLIHDFGHFTTDVEGWISFGDRPPADRQGYRVRVLPDQGYSTLQGWVAADSMTGPLYSNLSRYDSGSTARLTHFGLTHSTCWGCGRMIRSIDLYATEGGTTVPFAYYGSGTFGGSRAVVNGVTLRTETNWVDDQGVQQFTSIGAGVPTVRTSPISVACGPPLSAVYVFGTRTFVIHE